MLSWLRRFPHDVVHRKENAGSGGRRTSSSTTWRNRSSSFTARIIRCASSVVDATANNNKHRDEDDDCPPLPLSPPDHQVDDDHGVTVVSAAQAFSFRELAEAAGNFRQDRLIGEGGFGRVYKGRLTMPGEQEQRVVAVKQLDRNGRQGNSEFVAEVVMLSMLHHPNLVRLLGYCAEGDQRLLVYEHMALGSLEDHLLRLSMPMLPWRTRLRVAHGAARQGAPVPARQGRHLPRPQVLQRSPRRRPLPQALRLRPRKAAPDGSIVVIIILRQQHQRL